MPTRRGSDRPPPEDGWIDSAPTVVEKAPRLTADIKAEIRAAARVAVDEAVTPLMRAVQELGAALERERRDRLDAEARAAAAKPVLPAATTPNPAAVAPKAASPPLPPAPPAALPSVSIAPPTLPPAAAAPAHPFGATAPTPAATTQLAPAVIAAAAPRDLVFDSSPLLMELPGMLDGARRRRRLGWFIAFLLVVIVGASAAATILSYNHPL